ncbi:MAG: DUF5723 family protein [Salibacteraceae bacterium]
MRLLPKPSLVGLLFIHCLLLLSNRSVAQETQGMALSNYSITTAARLNPSLMVDPKAFLDINLVGSNGFAYNNYLYSPKSVSFPAGALAEGYDGLFENLGGNRKNGIVNLFLPGPSFTASIGRLSIGAGVAVRGVANLRKLPEHFARFAFRGLNFDDLHGTTWDDGNFNVKYMGWAEVSASYGYSFYQWNRDMWQGGVTLKRLFGLAHGALIVDELQYFVPDTVDFDILNFSGRYAYSDVGWNVGRGWGMDLGVTYKKMKENVTNYVPHSRANGCREVDYLYKVGVSLLDLGYIRYKTNANVRILDNVSADWDNYWRDTSNQAEVLDRAILSKFAEGDITTDTRYWAPLPTAITAHIDYNVYKDFYLGGVVVQRFGRPNNYGVERGNLLSIIPRYEKRFFEASLPVSLYDYRNPRIGISLRFWAIVLGTENVIPFIIPTDTYSSDGFFFLKYMLINKRQCKGANGRSRRAKCPGPAR